jgi:5-methylcytosine-specific restriction protein B
MNVADRSLALVDMALRRRFAFVQLEPLLNSAWRSWAERKGGLESDVLDLIYDRLAALNGRISSDRSLGDQFRIGHSYVTPEAPVGAGRDWFRRVVDTEIGPLLDEYWFDDATRAAEAKAELLKGL